MQRRVRLRMRAMKHGDLQVQVNIRERDTVSAAWLKLWAWLLLDEGDDAQGYQLPDVVKDRADASEDETDGSE